MSLLFVPRSFAARAALFLALSLAVYGGWRVIAAVANPVGPAPPDGFEAMRARAAYQTSLTCSGCHTDHASSWWRTYHRSMTQEPTPEAIQAPFDGRPVEILGTRTVPRRSGDTFFLDTTEPGGKAVSRAVARVTGSRRMQQFETREGDRASPATCLPSCTAS